MKLLQYLTVIATIVAITLAEIPSGDHHNKQHEPQEKEEARELAEIRNPERPEDPERQNHASDPERPKHPERPEVNLPVLENEPQPSLVRARRFSCRFENEIVSYTACNFSCIYRKNRRSGLCVRGVCRCN